MEPTDEELDALVEVSEKEFYKSLCKGSNFFSKKISDYDIDRYYYYNGKFLGMVYSAPQVRSFYLIKDS